MKTKLSNIFAPRTEQKVAINPASLLSDLDSIRINLSEIHHLKKKRFGNTLVHTVWREVELEEAWPNSQTVLHDSFLELCNVALLLKLTPLQQETFETFRRSTAMFIHQIDSIMDHIRSGQAPRLFEQDELNNIDAKILMIQHTTNRLNKYILKEFDFTPILKTPPRRPQKAAPFAQGSEEYCTPALS